MQQEGRQAFLESIRPGKADDALLQASEADVEAGRMTGPFFSVDEVCKALGTEDVAIARRFAVVQEDKTRPCDDARRSGVNATSFQSKRVVLSTLDSFTEEVRLIQDAFSGERVDMWKRDHASAYRQVPIHPIEVPLSVVCFWHPTKQKRVLYIHQALPFGFVASVIGYNRISQAIAFLANRILKIPVDSYFDDFWCLEPEKSATSGFEAFGELNQILGFDIKIKKDINPGKQGDILGHEINLDKSPVQVKISASRRKKLIHLISSILHEGTLSPVLAGTVAGKAGFSAEALYGKVGRAALQPIFARQNMAVGSHKLNNGLRIGLLWIRTLIDLNIPRVILPRGIKRKQIRAFVDAEGGTGGLGFVIQFSSMEGGSAYAHTKISAKALEILRPRGNYIQFLEMAAAVFMIETMKEELRDCDVILFCDNTAQEGALRKGYSRDWEMAVVAGLTWLKVAELNIHLWIERVPSDYNISDAPSRMSPEDIKMLAELGIPRVPAKSMEPFLKQLEKVLSGTVQVEQLSESENPFLW
ncbi:MAG: hypothetical protein OSA95_03960 [Opitutales bacterium]|nr:hypothetical protein [Opitutales bacterium]